MPTSEQPQLEADNKAMRRSGSGAKIISGSGAGDRALREMTGSVNFVSSTAAKPSSASNATSLRDAMEKQAALPVKGYENKFLGAAASGGGALGRWTSGGASKSTAGLGLGLSSGGGLGVMPSATMKSLRDIANAGDLPAARKLLEGGGLSKPDVNGSDKDGKTPLMCAASGGSKQMLEYLLSKRADIHASDKAKMTSLHHAAMRSRNRRVPDFDAAQADVVRLLVRRRAALNARDQNGCTALLTAVFQGDEAVTVSLLKARADVSVKDSEGQGTLDYATSFECSSLVEIVRAAFETQKRDGLTPEAGWEPLDEKAPQTQKHEILVSSDDTDNLSGLIGSATFANAEFCNRTAPSFSQAAALASPSTPAFAREHSDEEEIEHEPAQESAESNPRKEKKEKKEKKQKTEKAEDVEKEADVVDEKAELLQNLQALIAKGENGGGIEAHVKELKAALKNAQSAGVEGTDMEEAEVFVKDLKEREKATEKLRTAIADNNVAKLPKAIARAAEANVPQSVIDEAKALLAEADKPVETARADLQAAQAAGNAKTLRKAIDAARELGVEEAELEQFEAVVAGLEARDKAEAELRAAIEERSVSALKKAIKHANKAEGVNAELLAKAEAVQAEEKPKQKAREALAAAVESGELPQIKEAIENAKTVGLTEADVAECESMVANIEAREQAEEALKKAMKERKVKGLKSAIKKASAAGVEAAQIAEAEAVLKDEEPKEKAREQLAAACEQGTMEALKAAIQVAKTVNLEPSEYSQAEEQLRKEEEKQRTLAEVQQTLEESSQVNLQDIDALRAAKEKLGNAIQAATKAGVGESDIAEAEKRRKKLHNSIEDLKGSIRVFCRIRPLSSKEKDEGDTSVTSAEGSMTLSVDNDGQAIKYNFDAVFIPGTQDEIFEDCKDLVQSAVDGYNVTMFAYGQTGAGKTFTMYGVPGHEGTAPRTIKELYKVMEEGQGRFEYSVAGSMLELYQNNLIDLLTSGQSSSSSKLNVRRDKNGAVEIEHLTEEECKNADELSKLQDRGMEQRTVASTAMNSESSRSHLVLIIKILSTNRETKERLRGKILICDLAGSERLKKSLVTEHQQQEAIQINKSLTALGDVIEALTKSAKVIPYRNHKLTELMQDSLGGSAKTLMFVNCSPANSNYDETTMSLKYATRAKKITNTAAKKAA